MSSLCYLEVKFKGSIEIDVHTSVTLPMKELVSLLPILQIIIRRNKLENIIIIGCNKKYSAVVWKVLLIYL